MTRGRISNNLLGLIHQQDYLHQRIAEKEGSFETGLRGMRMKLTIVNNLLAAFGRTATLKGRTLRIGNTFRNIRNSLVIVAEYQVVAIPTKRHWSLKRSFGSWGVDVFAARGRYIKYDGEEVTPIKGVWKLRRS